MTVNFLAPASARSCSRRSRLEQCLTTRCSTAHHCQNVSQKPFGSVGRYDMRVKPGITDVASAAGVSISTVSVVLNDVAGARVNAETRERIQQVARRLGYVPNGLARGLRRQQSGVIGFLGDEVATTPYAVDMVLGAQDTLRDAGALMI